MDSHFIFYAFLLFAFVATIFIVRKIASCVLKLIFAAIAIGVVVAAYFLMQG